MIDATICLNQKHQDLLQILETRAYDQLLVRRHGKSCYFIIRTKDGIDHVFVNEFGKSPEYHHVWQIRKWLEDKFRIPSEDVRVIVAPNDSAA